MHHNNFRNFYSREIYAIPIPMLYSHSHSRSHHEPYGYSHSHGIPMGMGFPSGFPLTCTPLVVTFAGRCNPVTEAQFNSLGAYTDMRLDTILCLSAHPPSRC